MKSKQEILRQIKFYEKEARTIEEYEKKHPKNGNWNSTVLYQKAVALKWVLGKI